jgi:HK97 family phage prohead protease
MNEKFEFKSAANGAIALDELQGIVECFVAGIGNKDSVGDIVVTGAFAKSLTRRKPRVVWAHSWNDPIGKVLEMYEVPAGDPRLPAKMRNAGIGGLYAKVQFNLQSEKGKEAFASVAFVIFLNFIIIGFVSKSQSQHTLLFQICFMNTCKRFY